MNNNPFLQSYKSRILFSSIWILIVGIQVAEVYSFTTNLPFGYILADSLIFNTLFACITLLLWYPVRFNGKELKIGYSGLAVHVILVAIVIGIWLFAGYYIMQLLANNNTTYLAFLKSSIWWRVFTGSIFYIVTILIYYLFMYIEQLNEKAANEIHLNNLLKDGELNLLKSQINPHFLFNSLNSLNSLIIKNPEKAQEMLVALSDYLRYTVISTREKQFDLKEEIESIKHYLSIEKLRFGEKLIYDFDISNDCLSAKIPSMLLQPLYENAVKHGVYESIDTVCIQTKIKMNDGLLWIEISNDFDSENPIQRKGSGTGLQNIQEQLRLTYGLSAALHTKTENGKFIATLQIPVIAD